MEIKDQVEINADNVQAQMRRGVLEYCILSILRKGDSYASPLISELKQAQMIVVEGTLYPLLARQKNQGLLSYRWEESPSGPPRKYYSLTDKGRRALELMDAAWSDVVKSVELVKNGIDMNKIVDNNASSDSATKQNSAEHTAAEENNNL
jgi:PadR family transcriptional regulator, regulatory protein PadR